ncbi:MAG: hypothetical protein WAT66_03020 [Actinomycetota bacterium]
MTVRTRGVIAGTLAATRRSSTRRILITCLLIALTVAGSFFIGRRTAPSHRHPLIGSLDRGFDVTVGRCTQVPTSVSQPGFKILATIEWRSGWKDNEFPFHRDGWESNVHIGVSWDREVWSFGDVKPARRVNGYSVGPVFTPSGNAARNWAVREARRRSLLESSPVPDTFMQQLSNSYGVFVAENYYDDKPQARWEASFTAYNPLGVRPKPSTATLAMFDVDGSVIEKTVPLTCA